MDGNGGANQVMSEYTSTVTEVLSEKGMNMNGDKLILYITTMLIQSMHCKINKSNSLLQARIL